MNPVNPVPPLVVASVPARVIAPVVPVLGVNPVVPAEKLVTNVPKLRTPEPLVSNDWPLVPSALGRVNVTVDAVFGPDRLTEPPKLA